MSAQSSINVFWISSFTVISWTGSKYIVMLHRGVRACGVRCAVCGVRCVVCGVCVCR